VRLCEFPDIPNGRLELLLWLVRTELLSFPWFHDALPIRVVEPGSGFGLATVLLGLEHQGWITVSAALVLAVTDGDKCPLEFKRS